MLGSNSIVGVGGGVSGSGVDGVLGVDGVTGWQMRDSVLTLFLLLFCLDCRLELTFFGVKRFLSVDSIRLNLGNLLRHLHDA